MTQVVFTALYGNDVWDEEERKVVLDKRRYERNARQEMLDQALTGLNKLNQARRRQRDSAGQGPAA